MQIPPVDIALDVSKDPTAIGGSVLWMEAEVKGCTTDVDEYTAATSASVRVGRFVHVQVSADHDGAFAILGDLAKAHHRLANRSLVRGRDERVDLIDDDKPSALLDDRGVEDVEVPR